MTDRYDNYEPAGQLTDDPTQPGLDELVDRLTRAGNAFDFYYAGSIAGGVRVAGSDLREAASTISTLKAERDGALSDLDDFRERLHDLVMIDSEQWATGGGPGFKDRHGKAWARAREPFEP